MFKKRFYQKKIYNIEYSWFAELMMQFFFIQNYKVIGFLTDKLTLKLRVFPRWTRENF